MTKRRRLVALAAAAVLAIGGVTGGLVATSGGGGGATYSATAGSVHMAVQLNPSHTGTSLRVSVAGLPVDEHCTLVAVARDGSHHAAGQWDVTYSGTARVSGWTDLSSGQMRQLVLLGTDGQPLVSLDI